MKFEISKLYDLVDVIFLIPFLYLLTQYLFKQFERKHEFFSIPLMNKLFFYHIFFGVIYYLYASFNPSDSHKYFSWPQRVGRSWSGFFGTETTFINFINYPFINYLGFSYEMMMLLYTWIGFMGFVFAYLFFKENISLDVKVFKKIDFLSLILFLPNMHFWTASLGKGALIFLFLMIFSYSISKPKDRYMGVVISSLFIFYIRPHIFLLIAVGVIVGFLSGKQKLNWKIKSIICSILILALSLAKDKILGVVNLENSQNLVADFLKFTSNRANDLSESSSGVNMAGYSFPEKMFTFWFRPLFLDAPGILGVIVSFENLIYLLLFLKIFKRNFVQFIRTAPSNVKMSLVLFLLTSFAMTFVMSNLGIIIRQKSMIMYFLFFVIYYFLAHEKAISEKVKLGTLKVYESFPKAA
ncbi:hypothetical protein [Gillisia sp. Hel_I_29]|uniref:hypothetical protein n=1 Tax=Gillisia sp. Hel_I_29 TaxID=1249975 RepID=UPI00068C7A30|nr:hypothetical protein [Gillisia sp. Hel_I_29]